VGTLTIMTDKAGLAVKAVDTVWNDKTNTALTTVLAPCKQAVRDRCTAIWGVARTNVNKALASVKLVERSVGVPESNYGLGTAGAANLALAKKCFELFWGPATAITCKDLKDRLTYLKSAFYDDFTVRLITPQPGGVTAKASVRVAHKASSVGGGDHAQRIKFFALLVSSGRFDDQGINSMGGTLVHEMSHLVLTTVDKVYKAKKCMELDDADKIVNADNYKYYVELFQYRDLAIGLKALADSSPDLAHVAPED